MSVPAPARDYRTLFARNAKAMRDTVIFVVILSLIIAATLALIFSGCVKSGDRVAVGLAVRARAVLAAVTARLLGPVARVPSVTAVYPSYCLLFGGCSSF